MQNRIKDFLAATVMYGEPPEENSNALKAFHKVKPKYSEVPRLVNHFMLGADPEFVFANRLGERVNADRIGLRAGLFVGADQNGRLVEIRPKPDRSALAVVASILVSLRWLPVLKPQTLDYTWISGAWAFQDGLGGHIHFGRKRPTRAQEVVALDAVADVLYKQGVFPADEMERRRGGDAHRQVYGMPSDFRPQVHGYEYRSLPSWLDSPWLAYLCIVLGKLAVACPDMVTPWAEIEKPNVDTIKNLLAYYKGVDDDAAIALKALETHGLPKHRGGCFRGRWGICDTTLRLTPKDYNVLPTSVAPLSEDKQALFYYLVYGSALPCTVPKPTWEPTRVPDGFHLLAEHTVLQAQMGLGELLWDVVASPKVPIQVAPSGSDELLLSNTLVKKLPADWRKQIRAIVPDAKIGISTRENSSILIPKAWRTSKRIQQTKLLLTSGLFPLWRVRDAKLDLVKPWLKTTAVKPKLAEIVGKQLYPAPVKENS